MMEMGGRERKGADLGGGHELSKPEIKMKLLTQFGRGQRRMNGAFFTLVGWLCGVFRLTMPISRGQDLLLIVWGVS